MKKLIAVLALGALASVALAVPGDPVHFDLRGPGTQKCKVACGRNDDRVPQPPPSIEPDWSYAGWCPVYAEHAGSGGLPEAHYHYRECNNLLPG